ncbi:MAG: hypothetical protein ACTHJW_14790 [Streptosporangiaceae bacterium]
MTDVYTETGQRVTFACVPQWPGWCRKGRSEDAALAELAAYASRYAAVAERAGVRFDAAAAAGQFAVVERVPGTATTDFGALDVPPELDKDRPPPDQLASLITLVAAAWEMFEETAAAAPPALRKGPRGGGRDRDGIAAHVRETEVLHARMLGLKERPLSLADAEAAAALRDRILAEITAAAGNEQAVNQAGFGSKSRRPPMFVARRTAWHALDHAWEIQDKQEP